VNEVESANDAPASERLVRPTEVLMSRPWLRPALIGAAVGVVAIALVGAVYGGVAGFQLYLDDGREYHRPRGLDGAVLGAGLLALFGGLPAAAVGALAGVAVARSRRVPR
jgi:hypothetical protein